MTWRGLDIRWVVPRSEEGTTAGRAAGRLRRRGLLRPLSHLGLSGLRSLSLGGGLSRRGGLRGLRGALGAGGLDDVLLADAPADPRPGDGLQVYRVLGGELADQRGDVRRLPGAGQLRGRRVLLGLGLFGSRG